MSSQASFNSLSWLGTFVAGFCCSPFLLIGLSQLKPHPPCGYLQPGVLAGRVIGSAIDGTNHHREIMSEGDLAWLEENRGCIDDSYDVFAAGPWWNRWTRYGFRFSSGIELVVEPQCLDGDLTARLIARTRTGTE